MPETQIYYQEGTADPVAYGAIYNGFPIMRDLQNFSGYRADAFSFVNYFNQWGPQRPADTAQQLIDRNIQILAYPELIFPKRITSLSQVIPPSPEAATQVTYLKPLNPSGTFQGDKFRWFGTLQQIRIPECLSLRQILGDRNWLLGGYHAPSTTSEPADPNAKVGDTAQSSVLTMTQVNQRDFNGTQSTSSFAGSMFSSTSSGRNVSSNVADKYQLVTPNQIVRANADEGYTVEWNGVSYDSVNNQEQVTTRVYNQINFPLLLSPQFKPWVCFRLITLKFKVSMNEWFRMQDELPYRLNTMFWNKQNNDYNEGTTINSQWDRSTRNGILAKPNPYGGTFKICKNKKIFVNPFKGKSLTNWIYSKKRGKIINAKMWQPGQEPIAGSTSESYTKFGYYSNGLYVSLLLAPLNLQRDFDSFTANVLSQYFPVTNGQQFLMTKAQYHYQLDKIGQNNAFYQRGLLGRNIPNFPDWTYTLQIPCGIQLYSADEILVKTQTKYCEY